MEQSISNATRQEITATDAQSIFFYTINRHEYHPQNTNLRGRSIRRVCRARIEAHPTVIVSECADGEHYALLPIESGFDHIDFPKYELVSIEGVDVVYEHIFQ